ncbi:hypothetical protein [Sporosarcina trichiuri]|uniref:hypothetical protein n=1 Tax=Sporosarcina trichiuri TaxID=3056445 RepID=UPI0025B5D56C|nr:hypothetical protein [Sporosarcina sp. 0.2-SM1T-5]WJY26488.1 hypothetical protein QWT68_10385 [Sporosarcina sp. 0.2-SM1T-5]
MWKKAIPLAAAGFLLTACGNNDNDAMPDNDETPMEDLDRRTDDWTPEMDADNPDGTAGPNLDGVEEARPENGDDNLLNNGGMDGDGTLKGNGNAEGDDWGANSTEDGDNTAGTGNNGGSPKKDDKNGMK